MQLQLSQSISGYLMKKIREMELIADPDGRIMIPFRYSGVFPETSVQPDLADITSRLLRGGAGQLLNHGFERLSKILGSPKNSQAPVTDPSAAQPAPASEPTAPQGQVSGNDLLIQQGLALFEKYREAKKK
jgi:hypothetical protein